MSTGSSLSSMSTRSNSTDSSVCLQHAMSNENSQDDQFKWLFAFIHIDVNRSCQQHSSRLLTSLQRTMLPIFPVTNSTNEFYPLRANTPYEELPYFEQQLRHNHVYDESMMKSHLQFDLAKQIDRQASLWNIHPRIIICNLNRLMYSIKPSMDVAHLSMEEWFSILEIYLQMDVDCFFMKNSQSLFCMKPTAISYGMKRCKNTACQICYEPLELTHRPYHAIHFSDNQIHRFVNNYLMYLNCNVTCSTSNIIYALTCPCQQYDFLGQCHIPFRDRMLQHRMDGCRIMSNFFLGSLIANRLQHEHEPNPIICETHQQLYDHSTQCTAALHMFLTCHPKYWAFVPMTREQICLDNASMPLNDKVILELYEDKTRWTMNPQPYQRDIDLTRWCVEHIPQPPFPYGFSLRQKFEQYEFFRDQSDRYVTRFLHLYNAAIVMALSENASDQLRDMVATLLIIYAEPKLNSTGFNRSRVNHWFQSLVHPRFLIEK